MGTPMNMNVNEILANRANEILNCGKGHYECVHPNDDVNMGQSTNNVIPTALKIAALERLKEFQKELDLLIKAFDKKGKEFSSIKKTGRTHLQDAVPITLGKEFDSYSYALSNSKARVLQASQELLIVGIGGNAIGTAINTPKNYDKNIVKYLRAQTKLDLKVTKDHVGMTSFPHEFLNVSNSLNLIATDLIKICNDLRLLSSGPTAGFNEINLPAVEPGSSIMPGKLNPSVPECVNMICFDVIGNTQSILMASQAGQLQLNVMMPLIIYKLLFSIDILTNGFKTLRTRCIDGITANKEICESYFEKSNGLATLLNPVIGYDTAAKVAQKAIKQDKTIKQLVLEEKILSKKQWDELVKKTV